MLWGSWRLGRRLEARLRLAFLARFRALATATSRAVRRRTWPSAAIVCTACVSLPDLAASIIQLRGRNPGDNRRIWCGSIPPSAPLTVLRPCVRWACRGRAAPAHRAGSARPHPRRRARPFLARCLAGAHGRTHPRRRTGHAARAGEPACRMGACWAAGCSAPSSASKACRLSWGLASPPGSSAPICARWGGSAGRYYSPTGPCACRCSGRSWLLLARQYPGQRNVTLRLLEPLGAREEEAADTGGPQPNDSGAQPLPPGAWPLPWRTSVCAPPGTPSSRIRPHACAGEPCGDCGAVGGGQVESGRALPGLAPPGQRAGLVRVRPSTTSVWPRCARMTAWVDPAIQLWNRSLLDNLCYGVARRSCLPWSRGLDAGGAAGRARTPSGRSADPPG